MSKDIKLWPFDWKCVTCMHGVNLTCSVLMGDWMSITGWWLVVVLSRIFWPSFPLFFLIHFAILYCFRGNKGCVFLIIKTGERSCVQSVSPYHTLVNFTGLFSPLWYSNVKDVFLEYLDSNLLRSAFGLLQSAFQILIVHSSGLKKVLFSNGLVVLYRVTCIDTFVWKHTKMYNMLTWYFVILLNKIALKTCELYMFCYKFFGHISI